MTVTETEIMSNRLGRSYRLWMRDLATHRPERLCLFLDGEFYLKRMETRAHLEQLQSSGTVPSMLAVFVSHIDATARHRDFACNRAYSAFLVEELLPWIEESERIPTKHVMLAGLSLSGLAAAHAAAEYPSVFSRVLCQSPSAWWNEEWLTAHILAQPPWSAHFWISVGRDETEQDVRHEPTGMHQKTSQLSSCRRLATALKSRTPRTHLAEFDGEHDMDCWSRELPDALRWLFGKRD